MSINSYGKLNTPPIYPNRETHYYEMSREKAVEQVVETMPRVDQDFMYEQRKKTQQVERLTSAYLKLIRDFEFLPKTILLETFKTAVTHVFAKNQEEQNQQNFNAKICDKAEKIVEELKN